MSADLVPMQITSSIEPLHSLEVTISIIPKKTTIEQVALERPVFEYMFIDVEDDDDDLGIDPDLHDEEEKNLGVVFRDLG